MSSPSPPQKLPHSPSPSSSPSSPHPSSPQPPLFPPQPEYSKWQVAAVVAFYMFAALVMVCVNKIILNDTPSLVVTTVFIQALMTVLLVHLSALLRPTRFQLPHLSLQTCISLAPVMLGDVAGFTLNAFCLREVDSTVYQVARGLALPFTILVSALSTRTPPSRGVLLCAGIVTAGFLLGVTPPPADGQGVRKTNINLLGVVYGLLASLSVAVQAVLIKRSLPYVKGSALQLAYWRNLGSAVVLLLFMLARGEVGELRSLLARGWEWKTFVYGNLLTGVVGFMICLAGTLSVKVTSPVTHMFASAGRSVLQVLLGVGWLGEGMGLQRVLSLGVILGGTGGYTWVMSLPKEEVGREEGGDVEKQLLGRREEQGEEGEGR